MLPRNPKPQTKIHTVTEMSGNTKYNRFGKQFHPVSIAQTLGTALIPKSSLAGQSITNFAVIFTKEGNISYKMKYRI